MKWPCLQKHMTAKKIKKQHMKKFYKFLLATTIIAFSIKTNAQCISPSLFGSSTCNAPGSVTITNCNWGGEYSTNTLNAVGTFTFASSTVGDYLTLTLTGSTVSIASGSTPIVVTLTNTGIYDLHVANSGPPACGADNVCRTTSYTLGAAPGSPTLLTQPANTGGCVGGIVQFSVSSTPTNVTYQWQENNGGGFTGIFNGGIYSGATNSVLVLTGITGPMNNYAYRCLVTNTVSIVTSNSALLTVINNGVLPLMETFNASLNIPTGWISSPLNPWFVTTNHGTGGSNGMNRNLFGGGVIADVITLKVGPVTASTAISFDYRIVNWSGYPSTATPTIDIVNDSLNLYVSTNCGSTYTLLGSVNAANHTVTTNFYNKSFSLAGFAGSNVVFKFIAKQAAGGLGDYYVDVDNVNIFNLISNDAGVNGFVTPAAGQPCYGNNEPVVVTVRNYGNNTISNFPVRTLVTGAVSQTLLSTFTGSLASGAVANHTVGTLNMLTAGTYSLKAYTVLAGDGSLANDTLLPVVTRTVVATATIPYSQNFNAGLAMPPNWITNPTDPFGVMANHGTVNSNGMTRNLFATLNKAETNMLRLGPITSSTAISFDYRYVNWSGYPSTATPTVDLDGDSLRVMASINCGATFSLIGLVTVNNHTVTTNFTNKSYSLAALAGNDVIFKFLATRTGTNPSDYYIDVDNINLYNLSATDAGISAIVSPSTGGCYNGSQSVVVTVQNFGTGAISNIPVTVIMSGPLNATISATCPGPIAVGATSNFNVGNVVMNYGGVYTFSASTALPGDGNGNNDANVTTRTVTPMVSIGGPSNLCTGGTATLTANGAATYTWDNGSNATSITVTPSVNTTYSIVGTNTLGCTAIAFLTVTIQNPTISATGASGCGNPSNGTLTATAFSPATVSWYATPSSTVVLGTGTNFPVSSGTNVTYYAEANSTNTSSLFTTLAGGNGATGNMFDIQAMNALTLNGLDWHFNSNVTSTVEIWYRSGTFVGFETSNVGWTLAHTTTVSPLGTGSLTTIPGTFAVNVPAGQIYGIYVTTNGGSGINYTNGTVLGSLYTSNPDLSIYEGKGGGYFSVINSPRVFNGTLKYTKQGCNSPRVPATFTVVPGVTVTAVTNATSVCQGASASFTAFGAQNYTWSPAADISPSPNGTIVAATPTGNTTYTVLGSIPSCTQIGSYTINVTTIPSPTLSITPSQTVTPGSIVTLTTGGAFTYSWSPGGSNNTSILVNPTVTTVYTVTGTNNFSCTSSITTTVTVGFVGLNNYSGAGSEILLFPNPTNGIITVSIEKMNTDYLFEIFDLTGKLVYKQTLSKTETKLNLKEIANGMYNYKISALSDKSAVKQGKLVKQ